MLLQLFLHKTMDLWAAEEKRQDEWVNDMATAMRYRTNIIIAAFSDFVYSVNLNTPSTFAHSDPQRVWLQQQLVLMHKRQIAFSRLTAAWLRELKVLCFLCLLFYVHSTRWNIDRRKNNGLQTILLVYVCSLSDFVIVCSYFTLFRLKPVVHHLLPKYAWNQSLCFINILSLHVLPEARSTASKEAFQTLKINIISP